MSETNGLLESVLRDCKVIDEHSGKDGHREYSGKIAGRPWIHWGEKVVEWNGELYVVAIEGPYKSAK